MPHNGWKNYETWNVALWIQNDEGYYEAAKNCQDYEGFVAIMDELEIKETDDGVSWHHKDLDLGALNEMVRGLE